MGAVRALRHPAFALALAAGSSVAAADPDQRAQATVQTTAPVTPTASLTVATWGGAYGRSQELAFVKPFQNETGIPIKLVSHRGSFDALKRGETPSQPAWDVVDMGSADLDSACRAGLLEKFGEQDLSASGSEKIAADDFLPGAFHDCGVASVAWSAVMVFNKDSYKKTPPRSLKDFFDLKKFPGKRALPRGPKYTLELALMADGVTPSDVYAVLATNEGVTRAFAALEKIRPQIVWWDRGFEPLRHLADGTATLAMAFNGRVFNSIVRDSRPFRIVWDGQIYDLDLWAIPKGTANRETALRFIAYSIGTDRLAAQTRWFPYGPMRKSAIAKTGKHPEADVEMRDFIPTAGDHMKRALKLDALWWEQNEASLRARMDAWLVAYATDRGGADVEAEEVTRASAAAPRPKKKKRPRRRSRRRR